MMLKTYLKHWLPSSQAINSSKVMKIFGQRTSNPLLWYINRHSISKAVFIGVFFGLLPIPFHSVLIILAILMLNGNLPIGLSLAWLSNPLTIAPILYVGFWFGSKLYSTNMIDQHMLYELFRQISSWIMHLGHQHIDTRFAKILMSGLLMEAFLSALLLYAFTRLFWRWSTLHTWQKRHHQHS